MKTSLSIVLIAALFSSAPLASASSQDEQALMGGVQGFYGWVLKNGKQVSALQPQIKDITGSKKFQLDTKNLKAFGDKFMASGYFAPGFPAALQRYYGKYQQQFQAYTDAEFAQMARDGRGPLMETEDMDIFFCAQEYEYKPSFIKKIKAKTIKLDGDKASVTVISPYQWEAEFKFVKVDQRWLIAGYCVFQ
ncbi:hypothetical protein ACO0LF_05155 [Undibacterium sp. Di27W]|uniref:hypothetical protein n=1 Tax=Undibacterium sp. Di27W TaxID=3413036 RepID=UPI003BF3DE35